jgi:hypothetical protein
LNTYLSEIRADFEAGTTFTSQAAQYHNTAVSVCSNKGQRHHIEIVGSPDKSVEPRRLYFVLSTSSAQRPAMDCEGIESTSRRLDCNLTSVLGGSTRRGQRKRTRHDCKLVVCTLVLHEAEVRIAPRQPNSEVQYLRRRRQRDELLKALRGSHRS